MRRPDFRRGRDQAAVRSGERSEGWSTVRFIVTLLLLAWAIRSFLVAPFSIPSGSMLPTLYIGDYLVVAKWPYGYSRYSFPLGFPMFDGSLFGHLPKRGDVVVFRHPTQDADLIKRVIGLPGDTVAMQHGQVVLNGQRLTSEELPLYAMAISPNSPCKVVAPATPMFKRVEGRAYCSYPAYRETLPKGPSYTVLNQLDEGPADNFGPVRVPAGHVFLMGDNRDDSLDSRYATVEGGIGMVPVDHLIGRAMVTFWSTNGGAAYWKPWTWFTALRPGRIGNGYVGDAE